MRYPVVIRKTTRTAPVVIKANWDESDHPRDGSGRFTFSESSDPNEGVTYRVHSGDKEVANARMQPKNEYVSDLWVDPAHRRQGIATRLYDYIERSTGRTLKPNPYSQSDAAKALWDKRLGTEWVSPTSNMASDPAYVYHGTSDTNLRDIVNSGSLGVFDPSYGTDQDMWPDGDVSPRSYWSGKASVTASFTPDNGRPVVVRVPRDQRFKAEEYTGDVYTTEPVKASELEVLTAAGWRPLMKSVSKALPASVISPTVAASQRATLLSIADYFEPRIRREYLNAIAQLTNDARLQRLTDLIARGDIEAALNMLGIDGIEPTFGGMLDVVREAQAAAGIATARALAAGRTLPKLVFRFDVMNPGTVEYSRRQAYNLITNVTNDMRAGVRSVISESVAQGLNPLTTARRVRDVIGLDPRRIQALSNFRAALENGSRRALGYDIGGNAERVVNAALRDDVLSPSKIDKLVDGYRKRLLQSRAETIARTESMRAASNGTRQAWEQAFGSNPTVDRRKVRRYWVSTDDDRTRPSHLEIPLINANGVGLDEPFQLPNGGTIMYPHDPDAPAEETINCRCTVVTEFGEMDEADLPPVLAGRSILPTRKEWDEDEHPRDEHGRWTDGPGAEAAKYLVAGPQVDGLDVGDDVSNTGSIAASLSDYYVHEGIREIPMSDFTVTKLSQLFYAADDHDRAHRLAEKIRASNRIDPLIIVRDKEGLYILEGAHRFGALMILGKKSFPALLVDDKEDITKYDPDQPRDDRGRWTDTGASIEHGPAPHYKLPSDFKIPVDPLERAELLYEAYRLPHGVTLPYSTDTLVMGIERQLNYEFRSLASQHVQAVRDTGDAGVQYSVSRYTGAGAFAINGKLRSGNDLDEYAARMVEHIDRVMQPVEQDVVVYRGIRPSAVDKVMKAIEAADGGRVFMSDRGFVSTSMMPDQALYFAGVSVHDPGFKSGGKLLEIQVPKGSKMLVPGELSKMYDEREVILPRGSKFEVLSANPKSSVIRLRLLPAEAVGKYDPDQPRDERGRWTDEGVSVQEMARASYESFVLPSDPLKRAEAMYEAYMLPPSKERDSAIAYLESHTAAEYDKIALALAAQYDEMGDAIDGMRDYTSAQYHDINKALRTGTESKLFNIEKKTIDGMDSAMLPIAKDMIVYRGIKNDGVKKIRDAMEYGGGRVFFTDKAFVSTSVTPVNALTFSGVNADNLRMSVDDDRKPVTHPRMMMEIMVPKGSLAAVPGAYSMVPGEREIVLPRNSKFEVLSANLNSNVIRVRLVQSTVAKYDPDQPRDERGRWTDEGMGEITYENVDEVIDLVREDPILRAEVLHGLFMKRASVDGMDSAEERVFQDIMDETVGGYTQVAEEQSKDPVRQAAKLDIANYTASGHIGINDMLRHGSEAQSANWIKFNKMDAAFMPVETDVITYRGISAAGVAKLRKAGLLGATEFVDKGYVSTSVDPNTALQFAAGDDSDRVSAKAGNKLLEIHIPRGAKTIFAGEMSSSPSEFEVILPRGSRFKVLSQNPNTSVIRVTVVKQED